LLVSILLPQIDHHRTCFLLYSLCIVYSQHIWLRAGSRFHSTSAKVSQHCFSHHRTFVFCRGMLDEILLLTVMPLLRNCVIFSLSRCRLARCCLRHRFTHPALISYVISVRSRRAAFVKSQFPREKSRFVARFRQPLPIDPARYRYWHRRPLNPQSSVYLVCFARLPILIFRFSRLRQLDFYWDTCSRYPHSSIAMAAVRAVVATNALSRQINSRCSVSKSIKLPGLVQSRKFRGSSTIVMVQRVEKSDTEWAKEVRNRNQDPTRAHRPSRSEPRR